MIETGLIALVTPDAYVEADDLAIEDGGRRGLRLREAAASASKRVNVFPSRETMRQVPPLRYARARQP